MRGSVKLWMAGKKDHEFDRDPLTDRQRPLQLAPWFRFHDSNLKPMWIPNTSYCSYLSGSHTPQDWLHALWNMWLRSDGFIVHQTPTCTHLARKLMIIMQLVLISATLLSKWLTQNQTFFVICHFVAIWIADVIGVRNWNVHVSKWNWTWLECDLNKTDGPKTHKNSTLEHPWHTLK